jgi:ABC-2 type transport system ATP-binding protein
MRALLGLVRPDGGAVRFDGVPLAGVARASHVGALVDRPAVYPYLSAIDNLRVAAMALGIDHGAEPSAGVRMIGLLGLDALADRPVRTFSTGQRQRLGIALALLGEPPVVLLDEPVNGLDPEGIAFVRALLRELARGGRAVLLSSHLLAEVEQVCDRVVMLLSGRVVAQGAPAELAGGRRDLLLRFGSPADAGHAVTVLRAAGMEVREVDGRLVLPGRGGDGSAIAELLAASRIFPGEIAAGAGRLEDAFFELTGGERHDS